MYSILDENINKLLQPPTNMILSSVVTGVHIAITNNFPHTLLLTQYYIVIRYIYICAVYYTTADVLRHIYGLRVHNFESKIILPLRFTNIWCTGTSSDLCAHNIIMYSLNRFAQINVHGRSFVRLNAISWNNSRKIDVELLPTSNCLGVPILCWPIIFMVTRER